MSAFSAARLIEWRTRARRAEFGTLWPNNWDTGGCAFTSEHIEVKYGYRQDGGCYAAAEGERHIAHLWNRLPDGRILDATADQFDGGDGIRITSADDPRYIEGCDGESCNNGQGAD